LPESRPASSIFNQRKYTMSAIGFTTADLANAKAALASGALRVQLGDRLVIYRSQKEILELIRVIQTELNGANVTATAAVSQASFSKGNRRASVNTSEGGECSCMGLCACGN
jgi:hypothetical protein